MTGLADGGEAADAARQYNIAGPLSFRMSHPRLKDLYLHWTRDEVFQFTAKSQNNSDSRTTYLHGQLEQHNEQISILRNLA